MCLVRAPAPGPCKIFVNVRCTVTPIAGGKEKTAFDQAHVYSKSAEAASKRAIDLQIIGGDYSRGGEIRLDNETYLKKLIELASRSRQRVSDKAKSLQFFIVQGGGEGFLPAGYDKKTAGRMEVAGETTDGNTETDLYDENDIIAVFSPDGSLVSATRLERPLKIPGYWTEKTANLVYNSWHGKNVNIYRNTYWFQVPPIGEGVIYLGLAVQDDYRPKNITVDMHKQEDTNGCIFLVDDNTPDRNAKDPAGKTLPVFDKGKGKVVQVPLKQIDLFEPKFIVDILKSQGKKPEDVKAYDPKKGNRYPLGVMNIVRVSQR
jgi:hypothetical protein